MDLRLHKRTTTKTIKNKTKKGFVDLLSGIGKQTKTDILANTTQTSADRRNYKKHPMNHAALTDLLALRALLVGL